MKRTHLAISILGIATAVGAATLTCRVLILHFTPKPIVTHKLDHKPSKETIANWDAWRIAHTLKELDFACPPVDLANLDAAVDFIPSKDLPAWKPVEIEPDVTVATASSVGLDYEVPSGFVLIYPVFFGITFQPGTYVVTEPQPVPEPWSVVLVGLGAIGCLYLSPTQKGSQ